MAAFWIPLSTSNDCRSEGTKTLDMERPAADWMTKGGRLHRSLPPLFRPVNSSLFTFHSSLKALSLRNADGHAVHVVLAERLNGGAFVPGGHARGVDAVFRGQRLLHCCGALLRQALVDGLRARARVGVARYLDLRVLVLLEVVGKLLTFASLFSLR